MPIYYFHTKATGTFTTRRKDIDVKKACLGIRLLPPIGVFLLALLTLSLVIWSIPPDSAAASRIIVVYPIDTGANAPADTTQATDITVSGSVIYVTAKGIWGSSREYKNGILLKSTDCGFTWTDLTPALEDSLQDTLFDADLVAVAPDDPNIIVVVDKSRLSAVLSTNGGNTWQNLGLEYAKPPLTEINDIDISPMSATGRYIAIVGVAGGAGAIYYHDFSVAVPSWEDIFGLPFSPPVDAFWAVRFSPLFTADYCMLAVSYENTQGLQLNVVSFNTHLWNSNVDVTFPRKMEITAVPEPLTVMAVDAILDTGFFMGDEVTQTGFIGVWVRNDSGAEIGGVYRIGTYTSSNGTYIMTRILDHIPVNGVAWDGTNLLASGNHNIILYRFNNALSPSPTYLATPGNTAPGGLEITLVTYCGPNVIVATLCPGGGISLSTDDGTTFQMVLPFCLAGPVLEYPPYEASCIEQNPTFSWQPAPNASSYELQVAPEPFFTEPIISIILPQTEYDPDFDLAAEAGYHWRVRSLHGIAFSGWSTSVFIVNIPEITPFPDNGEPETSVAVTGRGFPPDTEGVIWFDTNGNNAFDSGEPTQSFITTADGGLPDGISLTVPSLPADVYEIIAHVPYMLIDDVVEASAEFTVTESPFPTGPVAGGTAAAVAIVAAVVAVRTPVKKRLDKKKMEKTKTEFQNAGIEIKIGNMSGKFQVRPDTPLRADKAVSFKLIRGPGRHSVKTKKPLVGDGKEDR